MARREDKRNLQLISTILLIAAFFAYQYTVDRGAYGIHIYTYPYRDYSPQIAGIGLIGIMASFFLPVDDSMGKVSGFRGSNKFCGKCGSAILPGAVFCSKCGVRFAL